jgi:hypothetical protein
MCKNRLICNDELILLNILVFLALIWNIIAAMKNLLKKCNKVLKTIALRGNP